MELCSAWLQLPRFSQGTLSPHKRSSHKLGGYLGKTKKVFKKKWTHEHSPDLGGTLEWLDSIKR